MFKWICCYSCSFPMNENGDKFLSHAHKIGLQALASATLIATWNVWHPKQTKPYVIQFQWKTFNIFNSFLSNLFSTHDVQHSTRNALSNDFSSMPVACAIYGRYRSIFIFPLTITSLPLVTQCSSAVETYRQTDPHIQINKKKKTHSFPNNSHSICHSYAVMFRCLFVIRNMYFHRNNQWNWRDVTVCLVRRNTYFGVCGSEWWMVMRRMRIGMERIDVK